MVFTIFAESACPKAITNAKEPTGCLKCSGQIDANSQCGFSCKDGFVNKQNVTSVHCSSTGQWQEDVNNLCISKSVIEYLSKYVV